MINSFLTFFTEGKKNKSPAGAPPGHEVRITKQWDDFKKGLGETDPLREHVDGIENLLKRKPWQGGRPQRGQPINNDQYNWYSRYNAHSIEEVTTPAAKAIMATLKPNETWIQGHFPGTPGLKSGRYA